MKYLSHFSVLQIRTRLQAEAGKPFDLMNPNALQSALAAPRQAVFGEEMHSGIVAKAAILFVRLILNHPFYDGNKRIAVEALRVFLQRNELGFEVADGEALDIAQQVAQHALDVDGVGQWLATKIK